MCPANDTPDLARRRTLLAGAATAGLATMAAWPALAHAAPLSPARERALRPEAATPDEALARLRAGNQRFVAGKSEAPHRDLTRVRALAAGQAPFAAFLGCADSRVPVEIVFDQGFGDIFVTRIAGNVADPAVIGSLEFGAEVLGASLVYVLGHSKCGAVSATIQGREVPGQISTLYQHIRRAAKEAQGDVARAVARNVQLQMEILGEASPVLARRIREGKLRIVGGVYDLETGVVTEVAAG